MEAVTVMVRVQGEGEVRIEVGKEVACLGKRL